LEGLPPQLSSRPLLFSGQAFHSVSLNGLIILNTRVKLTRFSGTVQVAFCVSPRRSPIALPTSPFILELNRSLLVDFVAYFSPPVSELCSLRPSTSGPGPWDVAWHWKTESRFTFFPGSHHRSDARLVFRLLRGRNSSEVPISGSP